VRVEEWLLGVASPEAFWEREVDFGDRVIDFGCEILKQNVTRHGIVDAVKGNCAGLSTRKQKGEGLNCFCKLGAGLNHQLTPLE
jgi:hypothetical protein